MNLFDIMPSESGGIMFGRMTSEAVYSAVLPKEEVRLFLYHLENTREESFVATCHMVAAMVARTNPLPPTKLFLCGYNKEYGIYSLSFAGTVVSLDQRLMDMLRENIHNNISDEENYIIKTMHVDLATHQVYYRGDIENEKN